MAVAYITGKIETLGSIFSQETPKGATGVPATVKMFFLSIQLVPKKELR